MRLEVLSSAEGELQEAVGHYNQEGPGLGYELAAEVKAAFNRIASFPSAWPQFSARARRCIVNRFPYGVLYQLRDDRIIVLAIMHLKRDPKRWEDRAGDSGSHSPST